MRGYKEEGTTTTPFDMVMLNDLDRFHLVIDVIDRVPGLRLARRAPAPADGRRARPLRAPTRASTARTRRTCRDWVWPHAPASAALRVLVVNAGSSSLKLSRARRRRGRLVGDAAGARRARSTPSARARRSGAAADRRGRAPHRPRRHASSSSRSRIDADVVRRLEALTDLAPLHQPKSLQALEAVTRRRCRSVPAVACFDTAFHARDARRRRRPTPSRRVAQALGSPPLRLPRPLARLRVARGRPS